MPKKRKRERERDDGRERRWSKSKAEKARERPSSWILSRKPKRWAHSTPPRDWYSGPARQYCVTETRRANSNDYERDDTTLLVSHTAACVF